MSTPLATHKQFQQASSAVRRALSELKGLDKPELPAELRAALDAARAKFEAFDVEALRPAPRPASGEVLGAEEVGKMLAEATKSAAWELNFDEPETGAEISERFARLFGVSAEPADCARHQFFRECRSRSDFWLVRVWCAPGVCWAVADTGRADAGSELMPNSELRAWLGGLL